MPIDGLLSYIKFEEPIQSSFMKLDYWTRARLIIDPVGSHWIRWYIFGDESKISPAVKCKLIVAVSNVIGVHFS